MAPMEQSGYSNQIGPQKLSIGSLGDVGRFRFPAGTRVSGFTIRNELPTGEPSTCANPALCIAEARLRVPTLQRQ
jgi:hypothetical protein